MNGVKRSQEEVKEIAIRITFMAIQDEKASIIRNATTGMNDREGAQFFHDLAAMTSGLLSAVVAAATNGDEIRRFMIADYEMNDLLNGQEKPL